MKKALACLLCMLIALLSLPVTASAADAVIRVESVSAHAGESVDVDVAFFGNPGINTCTFSVEYDADALVLDGVSAAEAIGGTFVYVSRGVWFSEEDNAYNGTFFTLHFSVKGDTASGTYPVGISFGEGDISNRAEEDVAFDVVCGGITVVGTGSYTLSLDGETSEYTAGETVSLKAEFYTDGVFGYRFSHWSGDTEMLEDATASEISFVMPDRDVVLSKVYLTVGDSNGDTRINGSDYNYMIRMLTGNVESIAQMDINADGRWNGTDSNLLGRMIIGAYIPVQ